LPQIEREIVGWDKDERCGVRQGKTTLSAAKSIRAQPSATNDPFRPLAGVCAFAMAILMMNRYIAELDHKDINDHASPSTPSGMMPIYTKPNVSKQRKTHWL